MSIFILVMAMLMVAVLPEVGNDNAKSISDVEKLNTIEEHMRSFMAFNGRRPCPADGQYPDTSKYFGQEAGTPGTCQGNASPTPNAPLGPDASGNIVAGVIPTRNLGLDASYAYDSYGRRFTYVVDKRATAQASCYALTQAGKGGLTIDDATGTAIDQVMYAYIQHGPSGYGAWPGDGSAATLTAAQSVARRVNSGSTDLAMQMDAAVAPGADPGPSTFAPDLIATLVKNSLITPYTTGGKLDTGFSDLVWYRDDIKNTCCLGPICPPNLRVDGTRANEISSWSLAVGDVNGDGIPDLIIGANNAMASQGSVYVVFGTRKGFPDPLPLDSLNGTNGFILNGVYSPWTAGENVTTGDVNGDGYQDIIIADPHANSNAGYVYVVFGKADWSASASYTLDNNAGTHGVIDGTQGFRLDDPTAGDYLGYSSVLKAADINGDGKADIIVGSSFANSKAGYTYVVFGKSGAWPTSQVLNLGYGDLIDGIQGIRFDGVATNDAFGTAGAVGDVNGDGHTDLVLSAPSLDNRPGYVYAIFGTGNSALLPQTTVNTTGGSNSATVTSPTGLMVGQSVSSTYIPPGTIIGAIAGTTLTLTKADGVTPSNATATDNTGTIPMYVSSQIVNTSFINGTRGVRFDGSGGEIYIGESIATGDVNGDGIDDIVIGAPYAYYTSGGNMGEVFVVFGKKTGWATTQTLDIGPGNLIDGTQGVRFDGISGGYHNGMQVAAADVNGDHKADVIMSSYYPNSDAGYTYVVFGKSASWGTAGNIVLNTGPGNLIDGTQGFRLDGVSANDMSGAAVTTGDINGDNISDIIIGADNASPNGVSRAGSTYVVFGHKRSMPAIRSLGPPFGP